MEDQTTFKVNKHSDGSYYIAYNIIYVYYASSNKVIAHDLGILAEDYIKELVKFNATPNCYFDYSFQNKEDAEKCAEYLNEKYGVIKKFLDSQMGG